MPTPRLRRALSRGGAARGAQRGGWCCQHLSVCQCHSQVAGTLPLSRAAPGLRGPVTLSYALLRGTRHGAKPGCSEHRSMLRLRSPNGDGYLAPNKTKVCKDPCYLGLSSHGYKSKRQLRNCSTWRSGAMSSSPHTQIHWNRVNSLLPASKKKTGRFYFWLWSLLYS